MRIYIIILNVILIVGLISCSKEQDTEIDFSAFDHYFVKNTFHIDSIGSFLEIHDTTSFYRVFGSAATMEKISWIKPNDFNDKFVISVIKYFKNNRYKLQVTKVSKVDNDLQVDYEFSLIESDLGYSLTGNCVILIKEQSYNWIRFYENGKFIKQINMD